MLQVIINLLDNAAKFSPPTTDITIRLKNQAETLLLTVEDQGKGIPKEKLEQIFEGYATRKTPGTKGLGLYLVKNILKLHKGTIDIQSEKEKGTTVEVTLPVA